MRLKWLRERLNISQKEMAERIGVSQQYYNKFEKGTGQPNLETLYKIRSVTEESIDFLIGYHFEDKKALDLYDFYCDFRIMRTNAEEMLEHAALNVDEFDHDEKLLQEKFKIIQSYHDHIRDARSKEHKSFEVFFEYISQIPGFGGHVATKEYWINLFDYYHDNDVELSKEFLAEWKSDHPSNTVE